MTTFCRTHPHGASCATQTGVSLLESLVALLVLALGVLGMLGVQLKTMSDNQNATHRVIAARLADDLFERIKANAGGVGGIGAYSVNSSWDEITAPPSNERCVANVCTAAQQAAFDMWTWQTRVLNTLPGGNGTTFISPSDTEQLGVMVSWRVRNTDQSNDADANTQRAAWLNVDVTGGPACPANSNCLVAYAKP